jgi:hypothetical protein
MRRGLGWLAGALGLAAFLRLRRRADTAERQPELETDPAQELRDKLEQARGAADDRDEFDAAEGQPVDEVEQPRSIDERRRAIHEKAQQALGEMQQPDRDA